MTDFLVKMDQFCKTGTSGVLDLVPKFFHSALQRRSCLWYKVMAGVTRWHSYIYSSLFFFCLFWFCVWANVQCWTDMPCSGIFFVERRFCLEAISMWRLYWVVEEFPFCPGITVWKIQKIELFLRSWPWLLCNSWKKWSDPMLKTKDKDTESYFISLYMRILTLGHKTEGFLPSMSMN